MSHRVIAARIVEDLEHDAAFHLRMGCPAPMAEAPLRERLVDALTEIEDARQSLDDRAEEIQSLRDVIRKLKPVYCEHPELDHGMPTIESAEGNARCNAPWAKIVAKRGRR
jgi:hypothetical protein